MPTRQLNPDHKIIVDNLTDYGGNIVDTFGLKLYAGGQVDARRGEIGAGGKMYPHSTSADAGLSTIGDIQSFIFTDADSSGKYWAADNNALYKIGSPSVSHFAADAIVDTPTSVNGDLAVFGHPSTDVLICPTSTDLWKLTGGAWTKNFWTTTLGQSAMTSAVHPLLFFPNPFLLLIPDGNKIHSIDQANIAIASRVQLPANHSIAWSRYGNGVAYFGVTTTDKSTGGVWQYDPVSESATFAPYDIPGGAAGTPYILDNQLYVVAPDGRIKQFNGVGFVNYAETIASKKNVNFILHRNGISVNGTKIRFLTEGLNGFYPAGVYTLDLLDNNFYHELPLVTGNSDAGQYTASETGAFWTDGQFTFAGAAMSKTGIFMSTNVFSATVSDRSTFVTPKLTTSEVKENWNKLWFKYSLFGTDQFVPKVRSSEYSGGFPPGADNFTLTWTSTTAGTTSASLTDYLNMAGYELTILTGTNGMLSAHISSITLAAGVYTITLDETIGLGSGTSPCMIKNWKKLSALTSVNQQSIDVPTDKRTSEWIQMKIEARGSSSFLKDIILETSTAYPVRKQ